MSYRLKSRETAGRINVSPVSVRKLPRFRVKSEASAAPLSCRRSSPFAGTFSVCIQSHELLAMQKVEGSNPFSRFAKGLHLRAFSVSTVGWTF
jgi:hypothetical protein